MEVLHGGLTLKLRSVWVCKLIEEDGDNYSRNKGIFILIIYIFVSLRQILWGINEGVGYL